MCVWYAVGLVLLTTKMLEHCTCACTLPKMDKEEEFLRELRIGTAFLVPPSQHCSSSSIVMLDHEKQIWQAHVTFYFSFWKRPVVFHGALNTIWWTPEEEVLFIYALISTVHDGWHKWFFGQSSYWIFDRIIESRGKIRV